MNLHEFLSDLDVALPMHRGSDDFLLFLSQRFDRYLEKLVRVELPDSISSVVNSQSSNIENLCLKLKEVISATFSGHPHEAYQHFLHGIGPLNEHIRNQAVTLNLSDTRILYRVRRDVSASLTREDIFHIPFEKRHLVSTQRYSIPGLPCLYLGGSIYTCWAEMGRPAFHELHASAFWLAAEQSVTVLNLSNRPARLLLFLTPQGTMQNNEQALADLFVRFLILWPLTAACSVKVSNRTAPFKPEYIVPQIVLQWITKEHQYDGLCYFSTHVEAITKDLVLPPCNLVFPTRDVTTAGRCNRLRSLFRMTTPHPWQVLKAVNAGEGTSGAPIPMYDFEFIDGRQEPYRKTDFGDVEIKLNKLAIDLIRQNPDGTTTAGQVGA